MTEGSEELKPLYGDLEPIGWPYCPVTDTENIVYTRMLDRAAEMEKQGLTLTDEDYSRLWEEELQKVKEQLRQRTERGREQLRRYMRLSEVDELELLEFIKYNGPVTDSELAGRFGLEADEATTLLAKYTRQGLLRELMGVETNSDVRSRMSSREMVKKYVIAGRGESKLAGLMKPRIS